MLLYVIERYVGYIVYLNNIYLKNWYYYNNIKFIEFLFKIIFFYDFLCEKIFKIDFLKNRIK